MFIKLINDTPTGQTGRRIFTRECKFDTFIVQGAAEKSSPLKFLAVFLATV